VILEGYIAGLEGGGRAVVLSEHNGWLRDAVTSRLRDPKVFWAKLAARPTMHGVPAEVRLLLAAALPEPGLELRIVHRQSGLESLGRPRFTAVTEWRGGKVSREARSLLPSAWLWAADASGDTRIYYDECVRRAVAARNPFLKMKNRWILRRLSPYCSRIELSQMHFLKIDSIQGESKADGHTNEIDIESFSWGAKHSSTFAVGGGGADKVSMQDFHFTMPVNKASPALFPACAQGDHIKNAILTCQEQQEFMKIIVSDCLVSSFQTDGHSGADIVPTNQISLDFAKIEVEYKEFDASGKLKGSTKKSFDLKSLKGG